MTRVITIALALLVSLSGGVASAGGLYLNDRGTQALGQGFAVVVSTNDGNALWYNPAALMAADPMVSVDATLTLLNARFQRPNMREVEADPMPLPVPTIYYGRKRGALAWGLGLLGSTASVQSYPDPAFEDDPSLPAPQRYSLLTLEGTWLVRVAAGIAWQATPRLSIGLSGHLVSGSFQDRLAVSACDGVICTRAEDPDFDAVVEVRRDLVLEPSFVLGVLYDLDSIRLGASLVTPYNLGGDTELRIRLPESELFDEARVVGDRARVSIPFPWIARVGIEGEVTTSLKVEAAVVFERWSSQDAITLDPENVTVENVTALGDYDVGRITIPREMRDVWSYRLGAVYDLSDWLGGSTVGRIGALFERGAFRDEYLSPLTIDSRKVILGFGLSVEVAERVWLDASYGHVFLDDREVRTSRVTQPNAIRPASASLPSVGNGDYAMSADILGVGARVGL
ncbi:MAG: outer membrane protein transport protein [Myxococcota bacterium]